MKRITIDFDRTRGFDKHDDMRMLKDALHVIMNQDAHDQFTLDQALEIIAVRVIGDDVSVYETDINSGARK
mgnify:CR=1 FL=1|tara:strand:+ start:315 stop:527 length:213 start_codon:yes stop_codon:yes gene_type:complete